MKRKLVISASVVEESTFSKELLAEGISLPHIFVDEFIGSKRYQVNCVSEGSASTGEQYDNDSDPSTDDAGIGVCELVPGKDDCIARQDCEKKILVQPHAFLLPPLIRWVNLPAGVCLYQTKANTSHVDCNNKRPSENSQWNGSSCSSAQCSDYKTPLECARNISRGTRECWWPKGGSSCVAVPE